MRKLPPEQLPFTQDEYRKARDSSALEYAQSQGYNLIKMGAKYFKLKEHDSMIFTNEGWWFWNSQQLKGRAIEFITQYEKKSFVEAVLILNGKSFDNTYKPSAITQNINKENTNPVHNDEQGFVLPQKADNDDRVKAYLIKTRKLDADIVNKLIREGKIYEDKNYHNAVFVNFDESHIPQSAYMRGTYSYGKTQFKGEVRGSNNDYPFFISGQNHLIDTINVYEASIDAISHATIDKLKGEDYKKVHRIALGGLQKEKGLETILNFFNGDRKEKKIKNINFCFDNDKDSEHNHGQEAAIKLFEKYSKLGYKCHIFTPTNKDFNEDLIAFKDIILKRKPLYIHNSSYAEKYNELEKYVSDIKANKLCAKKITEELINNVKKDTTHISINLSNVLNNTSYEFVQKRIDCVIAYNLLQNNTNGEISEENIKWANNTILKSNIETIDEKMKYSKMSTPPKILNMLAVRLREQQEDKNQYVTKPTQARQADECELER